MRRTRLDAMHDRLRAMLGAGPVPEKVRHHENETTTAYAAKRWDALEMVIDEIRRDVSDRENEYTTVADVIGDLRHAPKHWARLVRTTEELRADIG